jgi:hypothetical protein
MKCLVALAMCVVLPAFAQEPAALDLTRRPIAPSVKVASFGASEASSAHVLTTVPAAPPVPVNAKSVTSSCDGAGNALCYDYQHGRVVYRPLRMLMPEISGMRSESLDLRRDRITFRYSFP